MKHSKKILGAIMALATLGTATAAWAGYRWPGGEVVIDLRNRSATGVIGAARASADAVQYIGCGVRTNVGYPARVVCQAEDVNHVRVECQSADQALVQAGSTITTISEVRFTWLPDGRCLSLDVNNSSTNQPVQP